MNATPFFDIMSQALPFWQHLTIEQQELLCQNTQKIHYLKGNLLHRGNENCSGLFYVLSGTLRIMLLSPEGREITLYRLDAGNICIFSATCMLESIDFEVLIEADTDCQVLQVNTATLATLTAQNIHLELFSYKLAAERFSTIMWAMQQILFTSFDKRLAEFLLQESRRLHSLDINLTQEQIAKYLGSAREVVSRMLNYFAKEGYISLYRGGVHLTKPEALKALLQ